MNPSVLILGATSDIAQSLAYEYAQASYHIILAGRKSSRLQPLQSDLQLKHNIEVHLEDIDAAAFDSHQAFSQKMIASHKSLEMVVCAIGYLGNQPEAKKNQTEAFKIMHANYTGCVSLLAPFAAHFEQQGKGGIIGISSVAGERGRASNYFYGSAKAGFTAYLDGLRHDLYKSGVHVLTVKPGFVNTAMTAGLPLNPKLTAQPNQIAKAIFKAFQKKKNTLYYFPIWRLIMFIIRNLPEFIFKRTQL